MDNVIKYEIDCEDDLSEYSAAKDEVYSSLLFDSGETIVEFDAYDKAQNHIKITCVVNGEKEVFLFDEEGNAYDEIYKEVDDYPEELVNAIKNGEYNKDYGLSANNWYEAFVEVYDKDNNLVYSFEDPDITIEKTKKEVAETNVEWANQIFEDMYMEDILERPSNKPKTIEKD